MKLKTNALEEIAIERRWLRFNGPNCKVATKEYEQINILKRIPLIMESLEKTDGANFSIGPNDWHGRPTLATTMLGCELLDLLNNDLNALQKNYPTHTFHPYIAIFYRLLRRRGGSIKSAIRLQLDEYELKKLIFILNRTFHWIRFVYRSTAFQEAIRIHRNSVQQNIRSCVNYLIAHFKEHSRLLIIRIDLHFRKEFIKEVTADENRKALEKFLRALREGRIAKEVIAYISASEYGYQRGFHQHLLVALNSNEHQRGIYWAKTIGEYWEFCTNGKGSYFDCFAIKDYYFRCGIGMVHISDVEKLQGLRDALIYMLKGDYYIKATSKNARTMRKGNMPKVKPKLGAPRKNPIDTATMERVLQGKQPD